MAVVFGQNLTSSPPHTSRALGICRHTPSQSWRSPPPGLGPVVPGGADRRVPPRHTTAVRSADSPSASWWLGPILGTWGFRPGGSRRTHVHGPGVFVCVAVVICLKEGAFQAIRQLIFRLPVFFCGFSICLSCLLFFLKFKSMMKLISFNCNLITLAKHIIVSALQINFETKFQLCKNGIFHDACSKN